MSARKIKVIGRENPEQEAAGVVQTKKRARPSAASASRQVGGVRAQKVGALRQAPAPAAAPIPRALDEALGVVPLLAGLEPAARAAVNAKLAQLVAARDARGWVAALLTAAVQQDPNLQLFREPALDRALSLAIAYALPAGRSAADVAAAVRRLESLKWDDGSLIFAAAPRADEYVPAPALPEALVELAAGAFDGLLKSGERAGEPEVHVLDRATFYWRAPAVVANEREAERLKFIARGRATADAWGPPCPHCDSRNTVTFTTQTRANDEAATENFMCRDCGYTHRS
jgi:hypothetical protein